MKQIIRIVKFLLILLLPYHETAADEINGLNFFLNEDKESAYVSSVSDKGITSIEIPEYIQIEGISYPVTAIGDEAFMNCKFLQTITLPTTIREIGFSAFRDCHSLISIKIPTGVDSIPSYCFTACSNLQSIELPYTLTRIGDSAFNICKSLSNIDLPQSLIELGEFSFAGCSSLKRIKLPEKVTIVPEGCFYACSNLADIELNYVLRRIGAFALNNYNGDAPINLHLPPSVEYIGRSCINSGAIILYNGNVVLGKQDDNNVNIVVLDSAIPTIEENEYVEGNAHIYCVDRDAFLQANNYSSSKVTSIGKFGSVGAEIHYLYNGTTLPLIEGGLNRFTYLKELNIDWYCKDFDVIDSGNYSGTSEIEVKHNGWSNKFPISYAFQILKASLDVHINDKERFYGEENPLFDFVASGFKGNDNERCIENISWISLAQASSDVGTYEIKMNATSLNYDLNITTGTISIKKSPLTVIAENTERMYGDENPAFSRSYLGFKLNDTESSAFSSLPKLSCSATKTSDVGTYSITATGGDCKNYEIVEYKPGALTVTKAPLMLTANDASRLYYDDNPDFGFSLSGLRNSDDYSCLSKIPVYACAATRESDCGQYDIIPSSADAINYEIEYKKGTLTVNPNNLTLVASNISREYGEANPIFSFEAIGLSESDNIESALQEQPVLVTTATESSSVGEYPIVISGGSSKNYNLQYRSGVLTVTKAPLTVIAEDTERMYGDENPAFTRLYLGFKLNDTESSAFSSLPKLSCSATKTSDVGTYPVTVTGGTTRNYDIVAYESGTLTVTKAPLVLSANDKSRLYYEDNPTFDFSLTGLRNGDAISCLDVTPKYECQANKSTNVGSYAIIPSRADAKNYSIEYQNGMLNIAPRQLIASVGIYSKTYGTDNPNFEVTYNGFVNNEDKSVLTSQVIATCSADKASDVGTYPIILTDGDAINYVISEYNNGILSIEKANQTLTWSQDLSNIPLYSQIALEATSSAGLPVTYDMSPNNVATLYNNGGIWYLDCYGSGAVNIRALQNGDKNHNSATIISKTLVVVGNGGDPSNPQIYLNVETAGTLPTLIAENKKYQIKNLCLSGFLNGTDINFIREMAGSDSYGKTTPGVLETLDISKCTIVSGGKNYYNSYRTSDYKVGDYMFYNCKVITNLLLPDNTKAIEDGAFADCERLSVIAIPNEVISFGTQAFRNCLSLLRIPMPNQLTSIGDMAFIGCNGITEITIPALVSYLGEGFVKDCQNIERINVESGNTNFASKDGVLYTSAFDELLIFPVSHVGENYEVLESTTRIAPFAFVNAKKLKNLILPEIMASIGKDAFIGCVNLSTLQVRAITPPICDNDCFESVSKTRCELQVPQGCYSYYWVAPVWADFNKIVETTYNNSVEDMEYEQPKVSIEDRNIIITGVGKGHNIRIFQTDGWLLYQHVSDGDDVRYQPSANGIYIIAIDNQTYKIAVR